MMSNFQNTRQFLMKKFKLQGRTSIFYNFEPSLPKNGLWFYFCVPGGSTDANLNLSSMLFLKLPIWFEGQVSPQEFRRWDKKSAGLWWSIGIWPIKDFVSIIRLRYDQNWKIHQSKSEKSLKSQKLLNWKFWRRNFEEDKVIVLMCVFLRQCTSEMLQRFRCSYTSSAIEIFLHAKVWFQKLFSL